MGNEGVPEILAVEDLRCDFLTTEGVLYALSGVNLSLRRGEIHGLVGESGCGKSVTSRAILGLLDKKHSRTRGIVRFDGHGPTGPQDLLTLGEGDMRAIRGRRISMIFQDPALSPLATVGSQIEEAMTNHLTLDTPELRRRTASLLERVGLHPDTAKRYPFELSGGMQQRVMIAIAVSCEPELLIADEPTTALDVTIQAQVLQLLKTLGRELSLSVLLITHNFAVVAETCDRVSVMYAGQIVETAPTTALITAPAHPYSKALIDCIPRGRPLDGSRGGALPVIPGFPPRLYDPPLGCPFAPRCDHSGEACGVRPPQVELGEGHVVFCHHPVVPRGAP